MGDRCNEVAASCGDNFGQYCDENNVCHCICYDVGEGVSAGDSGGSGGYPDGSDCGNDGNDGNGVSYKRGARVMGVNNTITLSECRINNEGFDASPDGLHGFKIYVYGYPKGPVHVYFGSSYTDGTILMTRTWGRNDSRFNFIKLVGGQVLSWF